MSLPPGRGYYCSSPTFDLPRPCAHPTTHHLSPHQTSIQHPPHQVRNNPPSPGGACCSTITDHHEVSFFLSSLQRLGCWTVRPPSFPYRQETLTFPIVDQTRGLATADGYPHYLVYKPAVPFGSLRRRPSSVLRNYHFPLRRRR